ncbi:uncharacterized protein EV420DRAFT_1587747 [Desarmillaria tabescens]|uniref:Uncharacterized protein n=1 Tax=Armillaria tabescens TaxID=1929756 RepID=A0AA39J7I9_ARMTA|nr:uncharacterized protein EV420DRAFT_1587747 [Desarmillaria tabescens]KAK0437602.1 hypothetical protein EV420DRAFT_1587747 [Desarmillaria tabescens]
MVLLVHGLAHVIGKKYHLGDQQLSYCFVQLKVTEDSLADYGYQLETAVFGGIIGVVFLNGTATDPQLPDIAYFTIRPPSGKICRLDIERVESWNFGGDDSKFAPFLIEGLDELQMSFNDFLSCTCAVVNASYATVNIPPDRLRYEPRRIGDMLIVPPKRCMR